jgi:CheY-like chemotaxis protein
MDTTVERRRLSRPSPQHTRGIPDTRDPPYSVFSVAGWNYAHQQQEVPGVPTIDRRTILVVDDYAPTRQAYAALLMDCGYAVLEAANGGEAMLLVRQHMPHAVLMDIAIPVGSGLEAAESLRTHPATAGLPILGVTGSAGRIERERMQAVCDHLLLKPCSPDEIIACLGRLSTRRREARRAAEKQGRGMIPQLLVSDATTAMDQLLRHH